MKRITGSHAYTYPKCARAVALDFHGDRERRRPVTEIEEFVLQRGRDLEDRLTADLGYTTPDYPERDFAAGAAATLELLRAGVPGVLQGVLLEDVRLGIADLLRRESGDSALGAHHYVVGDVKSSIRPRGDQILQVMFYSRLLGRLQDRLPAYAYLVLRDGHEERFAVADYEAALDQVDEAVADLRTRTVEARPFFSRACGSCRWSPVCSAELEERQDLSLLQGMTRGLRQALEGAGIGDVEALRAMPVEATSRRTRLEGPLLRRLKRAAEARHAGRPLRERRTSATAAHDGEDRAVVHLLGDPFAERVYWFGVLYPAAADGEIHQVFPRRREDELEAWLGLIKCVPTRASLWHYGGALPRWYDEVAWNRQASIALEARFVDLGRRLRGAAVYPGPVFGLSEHVRHGLNRDPERAGRADAAGLWIQGEDAAARLADKGRADLVDLAALIQEYVEGGGGGPDA